jgi:hypothetical protein
MAEGAVHVDLLARHHEWVVLEGVDGVLQGGESER